MVTEKKLTLGNGIRSGKRKGQQLSFPNNEWFPDKSIILMKKIVIMKVHGRMEHAMHSGGFLVELTSEKKSEGVISQVREVFQAEGTHAMVPGKKAIQAGGMWEGSSFEPGDKGRDHTQGTHECLKKCNMRPTTCLYFITAGRQKSKMEMI